MCYCYRVKPNEPKSRVGINTVEHRSSRHSPTFAKVLDGRKNPIRGLWVRNQRFYAQLAFEDPNTGEKQVRRVPLVDRDGNAVVTAAQAKTELDRLKTKRADNNLPSLQRTPKFCDYADTYLRFINSGQGTKKSSTIRKETYGLAHWKAHLGQIRLDKIKKVHINAFIAERLQAGRNPRTVNLDVIMLRNVLKRAVDDGWIQTLPTLNMRPLKVAQKKRSLFTSADLERLCAAAFGVRQQINKSMPVTKNAQEFVDYIRFMAYSGARRTEALQIRWADLDFEREQLTIGAEGDTKNRTARVVDFNSQLKGHLIEMQNRRAPDSQWLFPSPQRGERDIHAESFKESLWLTRQAAGLPGFTFHDLRHHFISYCVMSGVDFMTIARWVGHRDGGILIGKVYGHLADSHTKAQAQRVNFGPVILPAAAAQA